MTDRAPLGARKEMIARRVSEVERIARGVGFGQVTIVIEKAGRVGLRRARAHG